MRIPSSSQLLRVQYVKIVSSFLSLPLSPLHLQEEEHNDGDDGPLKTPSSPPDSTWDRRDHFTVFTKAQRNRWLRDAPRLLSVILIRVHRNKMWRVLWKSLMIQNWGRHFSHENPHLSPISHFSGQNSIFCIKNIFKMLCGKWEMRSKHSKSSLPISDFPFLTSYFVI